MFALTKIYSRRMLYQMDYQANILKKNERYRLQYNQMLNM
jgi:hypothetical protein